MAVSQKVLIFDTETTGLSRDRKASFRDTSAWPRIVQLAWELRDVTTKDLLLKQSFIIRPVDFVIPLESIFYHGITQERALRDGHDLDTILTLFHDNALVKCDYVIGHNIREFDLPILTCEYVRCAKAEGYIEEINQKSVMDTCHDKRIIDFCKVPSTNRQRPYNLPSLKKLHAILFNGEAIQHHHDASRDVAATWRCFNELLDRGIISI